MCIPSWCGCTIKCLLIISVVIVILAYLLNPVPPHRDTPPKYSYDERIKFNLENLQTPTTHEQIETIVKKAREEGKKVRVLGAGHSWSHIAQTPDIMISLHDYTGIEWDKKDPLKVTVKAGTPLRMLSQLLEEKHLAMINLGSVAAQSLAGAISTATHGTGLTVGNLAALVTKIKFVSGTGKTIELSEDDKDDKNFRSAVVSIGTYGVLSEITIRVQKEFNLNETRSPHTLKYCLQNLNELVKEHKYVKMWVEFYNDFCALYQTFPTTEEPTGNPSMIESYLTYYSFAVSTRVTYLFPSLTKTMMWLVNSIGLGRTTKRVDKSYLIFNDHFELPIHQESEIIVPFKDSVALVETIRDLVIRENIPVNYITEVRFVKGDQNHISPSYGMDDGSCAVTLTIYGKRKVVDEYFNAVYKATRQFHGRIHWGKHFSTATHTDFRQWYDNFNHFAALRKKYDPDGIFVNDFIEEKFGFGDGKQ